MRAPTGPSVHERLLDVISCSWVSRRFHQQANSCYQLAWQCFDLAVAHKLNVMGNELTAKAGELRSPERKERQTQIHAQRKKSSENVPSSIWPGGDW
jgi:hypothetical protein